MSGWRVIYRSRSRTLGLTDDRRRMSAPFEALELAAEEAVRLDVQPDGGDVIRIEGPNGERIVGGALGRAFEAAKRRR